MENTGRVSYEIKTLDHMIVRRIMNISLKNGMDQVTVMHGWIIGYLYDHQDEDVYQKDLETEFCIARSTVANILKLMEKKGYIKRVSVERDARLKKIILTEKSREIQRQNFIDMHNMVEKQLRKDISEEDMENFIRIISKMKENLMQKETGKEG
ncbi:MAG: MarR family transcriptional regulator [Lachnospiraceae bacterium]|nr:MarR family transcriptional regulator [Lachnospiraceae bacterium]